MHRILNLVARRVIGPVAVLAIVTLLVRSTPAQQSAPPPATAPDASPQAPATPQAGAKLFAESGCTQCHGPQGNGTEKAPNIHEVRKRKTDEQIYTQIKEGKGAMPAFGDALSEGEIRSIVMFLRASDGWAMLPAAPK